MHELSIALEVGSIVERYVGRDQLSRVVKVALEVGHDAGVEFDSLEFCLNAVLGQPPFQGATAVIERVAGNVLRVSHLEVDDGNPDD